MSDLDDLFERARKLSADELEPFLSELSDEQRRDVKQRLGSTLIPDAESVPDTIAPDTIAPDANATPLETIDPDPNEKSDKPVFADRPKRRSAARAKMPDSVGPYKILQPIGEGGMGQVFAAEQREPVRRRVALKVINTETPTDDILARFEAERQALAMMDHQNIAKVLDAGVTSDGRPYFAMELVKGLPITDFCDKNRLEPNQRLGLFLQTCRAIEHAHQKGIIHRDLKPSNILVTLYDGEPAVKVIDFGLAKAIHEQMQLTNRTLFTQYGQVVGTLEYMSPEQAELNSLDVDTRTDVYSLGVILFELLTGSTPLGRERLHSEAFDRILALIREEEAPRPSTRISESGEADAGISQQRNTAQRKLSLMLKGELDWIAMKSLEKDRARRYNGAAALADDVERFLKDEPIEAHPPTLRYQFGKAYRRHRVGFLTAAGVLGLLMAGLLGTGTMWWRATIAEENASAEATKARESEVNVQKAKAEVEEERDSARKQTATADNQRIRADALSDQWRYRLMQRAIAASDYEQALSHIRHEKNEFPERYLALSARQRQVENARAFRDGHWEFICASVNPSRDRLVAADAGGLVSVWSVPEGRLLGRLTRGMWLEDAVVREGRLLTPGKQWLHFAQLGAGFDVAESDIYSSVCWTTDPQRVVATTMSGKCLVLDLESDVGTETKIETELLNVDSALTVVAASEDGATVAIGSADGLVYVCPLKSSGAVSSIRVADAEISCIRTLGDHHWLVGSGDGRLAVIDESPSVVRSLSLSNRIWDISTSPDGGGWKILVTTDSPELTTLSYSDSDGFRIGQGLVCSNNDEIPFNGAQYISSQNEIWAVDADGALYIWDHDGKGRRVASVFSRSRLPWRELPSSILHRSVAGIFDMDGDGVFTLGGGGTVKVWRNDDAEFDGLADAMKTKVGPDPQALFSTQSAREMWVIDSTGTLSLVDTDNDRLIDAIDAHQPEPTDRGIVDIVGLEDGRVATVAGDATVGVWKAEGGKIRPSFSLNASRPVMSVSVSEASGMVAAVDSSSRIHVWKLDSRDEPVVLSIPDTAGERPLSGRVCFNKDGTLLAAFGAGHSSVVFKTQSWDPMVQNLHPAGRGGLDLAFSLVEPDLVARADTQPTLVPIQIGQRLVDLKSEVVTDGVQKASTVDIDALPGSSGFVSVDEKGLVSFRSATHFVKTFDFESGVDKCNSLALSSDNLQLVISTSNGSLHVVSAEAFQDAVTRRDVDFQSVEALWQRIVTAEHGHEWVSAGSLVRQKDGTYAMAITCGNGNHSNNGQLLFAKQTDSDWKLETIYSDPEKPVDKHGTALIDSGGPVVAFRRRTVGSYSGDLLLAHRSQQQWRLENIVSGHNAGHYPLICTNTSGEIHSVLHYDHGFRGLMASVKEDSGDWRTRWILPTWGLGLKGVSHNGLTYVSYGSHRHNNDALGGKGTWDGSELKTLVSPQSGVDNVLPDGRFYNVIESKEGRRVEIWESKQVSKAVDLPPRLWDVSRIVLDAAGTVYEVGWDKSHEFIQIGRYAQGMSRYFQAPAQPDDISINSVTVVEPDRLLIVSDGAGTVGVGEINLGP